ncbi:MAG: hypothetical protein ACYSQZ_03585 [Planctomycetota bacterium]|jgi:hypothetical protein
MDLNQRQKRVRMLVGKLNRARKSQAKKIDMLCNDIIGAQWGFIKRLDVISFTANFYKTIVGITELDNLLYTADNLIKEEIEDVNDNLIKEEIEDVNVAFFLRQAESFKLHMFESNQPIAIDPQHLENCFTNELVGNICESNKVCTLENLFEMGLQGNPAMLSKISVGVIPLGHLGLSLGFILIYRPSENKLTTEQIARITAITPGLSRAISTCQTLLQTAD